MIDLSTEPPIHWRDALEEPALRTKKNSRDASRWARLTKTGIKRDDGERVRLECVRLPHGPHTSRAAIERFIARLNGVDVPITPAVVGQTNAAMAELTAAGIA